MSYYFVLVYILTLAFSFCFVIILEKKGHNIDLPRDRQMESKLVLAHSTYIWDVMDWYGALEKHFERQLLFIFSYFIHHFFECWQTL
jgi:hypothetical protein